MLSVNACSSVVNAQLLISFFMHSLCSKCASFPKHTTFFTAFFSCLISGARSAPLERPPKNKIILLPAKLLTAAKVEAGVVAFESL